MIDIHFICRDCGTPCDSEAARERGGLCSRCAFPLRVTRRVIFINGVECASTEEALAAIRKRDAVSVTLDVDADPFKRAIDRALTAWAKHNPEG